MNERPTWPAPEIKVRKETNVPYLKFGKNTQQKIRRIRKLFVGSKMARNQKRQNNDDESDEEKPKERGHKDLKTRSKNSRPKKDKKDKNGDEKSRETRHKDPKTKMKPKNIGHINSHDLEKSIAGVLLTIDKRKGKGSLEEKEVQKHHDAIITTVNKTTDLRKSTDKQKTSQKPAPRKPEPAPRIPVPSVPENGTPTTQAKVDGNPEQKACSTSKRKNRNGSNSESDSSDPIKSKSKKAKRSRISETSEEQTSSSEDKVISPPPPPNESPRSRHRRIQMDIRSKNGHQRNTSKT